MFRKLYTTPLDSETILARLGRAWIEFPVDFELSWTNLKGLGYDLEPSLLVQKSMFMFFRFRTRSLQYQAPTLYVGGTLFVGT